MSPFDSSAGRPQGRAAALHQGRIQQPIRKPSGRTAALHQGRPAPPPAPSGRAAALHHGRRENTAPLLGRTPAKEYVAAIRQTIAFSSPAGVVNSRDQSLHVRGNNVRTWVQMTGHAPFPNLWDEFTEGTGPQNSVFLENHPVCRDIFRLHDMQIQIDRVVYLLYDKYKGAPKPGDSYTDMSVGFSAMKAVEMASTAGNDNYTFIGSCNISAFYSSTRILILLSDAKTQYSLWGHLSHAADHYRFSQKKYGNTYQFYFWSAPFKSAEWYAQTKKSRNKKGFSEWWKGF